MGFIGLPTPANALFWGSLILTASEWFNSLSWGAFLIIVLMLVSCWLLISEVPMFALKFKHWGLKGNELRYGFLAVSALVIIGKTIVGYMHGSIAMGFLGSWWIVIVLYILVSVIADLSKRGEA